MKPVFEHLPKSAGESFVVRDFEYDYFPTPWHFHPEYEIVLVTESTGKRFIGDNISNFKPGNLALLGANLPHLYRSDEMYYQSKLKGKARSIVVHFSADSFGADFFSIPEANKIKQLLNKSLHGIEITGVHNAIISKKLFELVESRGFNKCLKFFEILQAMAEIKKLQLISNYGIKGINGKEFDRMNAVLVFLMKNFSATITRKDAAKVAHLSENAFSRYFSQRTRKTFAGYLNELRLSHAAKLLIENNQPIVDICYECGFSNLSNFNRQFKLMHHIPPMQYRKTYLG